MELTNSYYNRLNLLGRGEKGGDYDTANEDKGGYSFAMLFWLTKTKTKNIL